MPHDHHNGLPGLGLSPLWQAVTAVTGGFATGVTSIAQHATTAANQAGVVLADVASPWWTPLVPLVATLGVPTITACFRLVDQRRVIVALKRAHEAESARLNAEIAANRAEIARLNREQEAEREQIERARCLFADPDGVARCRRETTEISTDDLPPNTDVG